MLTVNMNRPISRNPMQISKGADMHQYDIDRTPQQVFKQPPPTNWQNEAMPDKSPPYFGSYDQYGNFVASEKQAKARRSTIRRMGLDSGLVGLVNNNRRKF